MCILKWAIQLMSLRVVKATGNCSIICFSLYHNSIPQPNSWHRRRFLEQFQLRTGRWVHRPTIVPNNDKYLTRSRSWASHEKAALGIKGNSGRANATGTISCINSTRCSWNGAFGKICGRQDRNYGCIARARVCWLAVRKSDCKELVSIWWITVPIVSLA
jgi:hypothetical protein